MKLISWNVNGIRAAQKAGFQKWFAEAEADLVCLQEVRALPEQLDEGLKNPSGYHSFWMPATKPGYSGVATYTRLEPQRVSYGLDIPEFDVEGRVLITEFKDFAMINAYFPNSQREHARLPYKLRFCAAMLRRCEDLKMKGKSVIICGDFNIAHKEIDLRNPKTNKDNAGFLPQERAWMDELIGKYGYLDTFREFEKGPDHYSWWSNRPGVREKNVGWRLDYHVASAELKDRLKSAELLSKVKGSDHCPVVLELRA